MIMAGTSTTESLDELIIKATSAIPISQKCSLQTHTDFIEIFLEKCNLEENGIN